MHEETMPEKEQTVIGGFKTMEGASLAASRVVDAGFTREEVSVVVSDSARDHLAVLQRHSRALQGAALGGIGGSLLGAAALGLTAVASLVVPQMDYSVSGPAVAALIGAGAGAITGGLGGALVGLGMSEHEATFYREMLEGGGVVVAVSAATRDAVERATHALRDSGALKLAKVSGHPVRL